MGTLSARVPARRCGSRTLAPASAKAPQRQWPVPFPQRDQERSLPATYQPAAKRTAVTINSATRIPELDGLRGIAISLVLFYHFVAIPFETFQKPRGTLKYLSSLGMLGWSGVDLFFVLSGFLIGGILLDARTSPRYFKTFYIRRSYRILPIYWVLLVLLLLGGYLTAAGKLTGARPLFEGSIPWLAYATFTQNVWMALSGTFGAFFMAVTWSLAIEEQFYLTLPLAIRFVNPKRLPFLLVGVIFAAPLLRILISFYHPPRGLAPYVLMLCRADALVLGVLAAFLLRQQKIWSFLANNKYVMRSLLGVFLLGVIWFAFRKYSYKSWQMVWVGYTWFGLFYTSALVIAVTQTGSLFSRCLRIRLLMGTGQIAYGLYLIHDIIRWLCHTLIPGGASNTLKSETLVGITALGLTILIARLSWTYFEQPLLKRGRAFNY